METSESNKTRRRWSAAEKENILEAYAARKQTQAEFCRERGFSVAALAVWLRKSRLAAANFIEVPAGGPSAREVLVELVGGVVLRAPAGTDPCWLGKLIQELRCGG